MTKWPRKVDTISEGFVRYVIGFRYNGSYYCGWQSNGEVTTTKPSLCETIGNALNKFIGPNSYKNLKISSRTDAGVHAIRNVLQVDMIRRKHQDSDGELLSPHDIMNVKKGLNFYLGEKLEKMYVTDVAIVHQTRSSSNMNNDDKRSNEIDKNNMNNTIHSCYETIDSEDIPNHATTVSTTYSEESNKNKIDLDNDYTDYDMDDEVNDFDVRGSATGRKYVYHILCAGVTSSSSYASVNNTDINSQSINDRNNNVNTNNNNNNNNKNNTVNNNGNTNNNTTNNTNNNTQDPKKPYLSRFDDTRRLLFHNDLMWIYNSTLNITHMNQACQHLQGVHDFTSFRARSCQSVSAVRDVTELYVSCVSMATNTNHHDSSSSSGDSSSDNNNNNNDGNNNNNSSGSNNNSNNNNHDNNNSSNYNDGSQSFSEFFYMEPGAHMITVTISANSFLQRMVRNIVGCLIDVGTGRIPGHRIKEILDAKKRGSMMYTQAPAHGLYLVNVLYDKKELTARQRSMLSQKFATIEDFQNSDINIGSSRRSSSSSNTDITSTTTAAAGID